MNNYTADLYGNYTTEKFTDIYPNVTSFTDDLAASEIPISIKAASQTTLYYLLYSMYGNSSICNSDLNMFKYKMFSLIFQYGPNWEKRLDVQDKLRSLTASQLVMGGDTIYNHSFNPSTAPTTSTLTELTTIDDQNVSKYKKSVMEGYATLIALLEDNITLKFINKFKGLFISVVQPQLPLWYTSEGEE